MLKFLPAGRQGYTGTPDMYYVYVLKSLLDGTYYKGRTKNFERRLKEHESGQTSSDKQKRPFKLIHVELEEDLMRSIALERFLKSGYGREIIKIIDSYY